MITILTPTYNREKTLKKCYESLINQSDGNFEWIIVDDGSTDSTKKVVDEFIKQKKISIKYIYKSNGGKCSAINYGVNEASGELLIILDSDDYLDNNAINIVNDKWKKYKANKKIAGMVFLRKIKNPIYKEIPFDECVSNMIDFKYNKNNLSDMCEVMRTNILKEYPYPVFDGEKFLSEVIVTGKIAEKYDLAYIPIEIYYAEYLEDGLSNNWLKLVVNNPKGARANSLQFMSKRYRFAIRLKNCIEFNVFSIISNQSIFRDSPMKFLSFIFYLPSYIVAKMLIFKYKEK